MSKYKLDYDGLDTLIIMIKNYVSKLFLPLTGGTISGNINKEGISTSWNKGRDNALISINSIHGYSPFASIKTNNGSWEIGAYDNSSFIDQLVFTYIKDTDYSGDNKVTAQIRFGSDNSLLVNGVDLNISGIIVAYAKAAIPTGWLLCDGSAISRTTYSKLFATIGTTYGTGDGSTTFNLPNLTDRFIQGNNTVGTVKNAGLPNITGNAGWITAAGNATSSTNGAFGWNTAASGNKMTRESGTGSDNLSFNASKSSSIYGSSSTVQPPALTMRFIIKY